MITPNGLYQWTRLPFRLCSAPSAFQKMISKIIEGCPRTKNLLDDILVAGVGFAVHDKHLEMVLQKLKEFNSTANACKGSFGVTSVELAGHEISKDCVRQL